VEGKTCQPDDFTPTPWELSADVQAEGDHFGEISVYYTREMPPADVGPFLKEERRLLDAIADRIGSGIVQRRVRVGSGGHPGAIPHRRSVEPRPWNVLLDFLQRTDPALLTRITRKMINFLCWSGIAEAEVLLQRSLEQAGGSGLEADENRPTRKHLPEDATTLIAETFDIAARHLSEADVITQMQGWINEEKSTFLIKSLENPGTGLAELAEAVERHQIAGIDENELPVHVQTSLKVALLRRFFVEALGFVNLAKNFVRVQDFYELVQKLVFPSRSQGKLGGKGAGLFLAMQVLSRTPDDAEILRDIRVPKTWYVASDAILELIQYNSLNEVYNRKYMEIGRVRQDYPHVVQLFKNSRFPPEITKGLAAALDDFGEVPLIVRSSSLLEDQAGASFSGKYKSLFLANQGAKPQRLAALQDAVAEVYASVFGPDPIEYRAERGLLDFREEMAILIQEVVGKRVGKYFIPAFSGVAFSNNEFRWSSRIKREDGLVRLVPGLGTRAVDRVSDDYPVLVSPGQPGLRVNVTPDEVVRYSPKRIDVINLKRNVFETVDILNLLRETGENYPLSRKIVSIVERNHIRKPFGLEPNWDSDDIVVTFEGVFSDTHFMDEIGTVMRVLRDRLEMHVDVEFAHDGEHFYLLQCRAQSHSPRHAPAAIPRNLPRDRILFSANRYISNGRVPDITHIVYIDPDRYANLAQLRELQDVGRAVGRLNKMLPRRQFVLMGPGRWGSRGDIKLGVNVTYSDINNAAVLVEVARQKGNYVPELSFGTHFFQDLVEAEIRYLPLYPDDEGIVFDELFLRRARNILPELLPDLAHLADSVRVVDVPRESRGKILRILMNADLDEAVGIFDEPGREAKPSAVYQPVADASIEDHWSWRLRMAEEIAVQLDGSRFDVKAIYVFGSTKNATAGPASDIDLIVHVGDDQARRRELELWLKGWSMALAAVNFLRTGYETHELLDVHYVTDVDIADQRSYAAKIGAVTDAARPLPMSTVEGHLSEGRGAAPEGSA
jgi:predicted nucleotidyltransferase